MNRRHFHRQLASVLAAAGALPGCAQGAAVHLEPEPGWQAIEARTGGRLGIAVLQADGRIDGYRLDERFAMCSTFKWLAAAHVLNRVDRGLEQLDRRISYGREALRPHSPISSRHVGAGMTLAELCHATVTVSDNAAGNLVLASFGGPQGLTQYARSLGDAVTRLDRWETELNEAAPGDPRDTTSPRAMARLLHATLLGDALSSGSRRQLGQWLEQTETNRRRLGANLPSGWRVGSKTGTGGRGSTNDVGILWRPGRAPVIVAAYLTQTDAPLEQREAAIAEVARRVHRM